MVGNNRADDSELVIDRNLTITGPGANMLSIIAASISGTPSFRLFNITFGSTVSISGLTLSNGRRHEWL